MLNFLRRLASTGSVHPMVPSSPRPGRRAVGHGGGLVGFTLVVMAACGEPARLTGPTLRSATAPSLTTQPADCAACVFGPRTFTRASGQPAIETAWILGNPSADYTIDIDDDGT